MGARAAVVVLAAGLAGCALTPPPSGPELAREALPHMQMPASTWDASSAARFDDPALTGLVEEALAHNADLRLAAARVEQAAGYARLAGASLYPALNAVAHGGGKLGGDGSGLTGGGFFASWEIDLWGRTRASRDAGREQLAAAELDATYARQSIGALVTRSWLLAIEAKLQQAMATERVAASRELLRLERERLRIGRGDALDVASAEAALRNAEEAERNLALGAGQARRALESLLGRYPAAEIAVASALPRMPAPVPAGLPSQLLERRPDVRAAERRVAAAYRRVDVARAARLPAISLTASVTQLSSELIVLKDVSNPMWSLGGNLVAPIFTGQALAAQESVARAEQQMAVAEFGRVGARAFSEVEAALAAEFAASARVALLEEAVRQQEKAAGLATVRFKVGKSDQRAVEQQRLALSGTRSSLLRVQAEQRLQRTNLLLALGG